jgi:hypothetical protein
MKTRYKNPWHNPKEPQLGPEYFETNVKPVAHAGALIYRYPGGQCDVVKAGTCIAQRSRIEGAKIAAEVVSDIPNPTYKQVGRRELEAQGVRYCKTCDQELPDWCTCPGGHGIYN